jgi:hypothetical protein
MAIFKPGINIVTGPNNSGKTAVLKALDLTFNTVEPHRSIKTIPVKSGARLHESEFWIGFGIKPNDFKNVFAGGSFMLPASKQMDATEETRIVTDWLKGDEEKAVSCYVRKGASDSYKGVRDPLGLNLYPVTDTDMGRTFFLYANGELKPQMTSASYSSESFVLRVLDVMAQNIYRFYAERFQVGKYSTGNNHVLKPDASNLPEVLHLLHSDTMAWERYNKFVGYVLPNIKRVYVVPVETPNVEIKVSPLDLKLDRADISFPLSECGTGVSQVLAMLYVILTSYTPKTIIIDEPSSFLHPGAEKALIEIFKQFPQHQYIIGTHSAITITAAEPLTITNLVLSEDSQETTFREVNRDERIQLQRLLADLGLSLSDVFGADSVLWVEGETEHLCFPLLLAYAKKPLYRTEIAKIWQTSDLDKKKPSELRRIIETYERLSCDGTNPLAPKALGFFLDSEDRSDEEINDIERFALRKIGFTNYRHYENYILHPRAISEVLNAADSSGETRVTVEQIDEYIGNKQNRKEVHRSKT